VDLLRADVSDINSRVTSPQLSCWHKGTRKKNSSSSDHTIASNKAPSGDDGVHPDDGVVFDVTGGQDCTVTDRHIVLNHHTRREISVEILSVVDHDLVLDVGVMADGDGVIVASEHSTIPNLRRGRRDKEEKQEEGVKVLLTDACVETETSPTRVALGATNASIAINGF
jgi:hypothetical protein